MSLFRRTRTATKDKPKDPLDINPAEWRVSTRRLIQPGDCLVRMVNGLPNFNDVGYILTSEDIAKEKEKTSTFSRCTCCVKSKGNAHIDCYFDPITHVAQLRGWVIIEPKEPIANLAAQS